MSEEVATAVVIPPPGKIRGRKGFRLPHGAEYHAKYDAVTEMWTVVLEADGKTMAHRETGVHQCLRKLSKKWEKQYLLKKED